MCFVFLMLLIDIHMRGSELTEYSVLEKMDG
jgi:hypothetical protein